MRASLEKVVSSPQFSNSKRYPAFLRYVVEHELVGDTDQIKERTIGIEVFGRAPDYDTNADTAVRYTASEVRKRLALYYNKAAGARIQIELSTRSYQPEFYRLMTGEGTPDSGTEGEEHSSGSSAGFPLGESGNRSQASLSRKIFACLVLVLLGGLLTLVVQYGSSRYRSQASTRFWSPLTSGKGTVLISPGGDVFTSSSTPAALVSGSTTEFPYLSLENGLAMGRITAVISSRGQDYRVEPTPTITLPQMRENPVVLIGAYNNAWAQRLLLPLRFHFSPRPDKAIIDAWHTEKRWARDSTKPFSETPDYGLVARFHNPSTDSIVLVVAGLQRYGTDAASQFVVSSRSLGLLNQRIGSDWTDKNVEVVIRTDVVNGKAGVPIIEGIHVW